LKRHELPRWLRTVRHLRPGQGLAQLRYAASGGVRVAPAPDTPPAAIAEHVAVPFLPAPEHADVAGGRLGLLNREMALEPLLDWDFSAEGPLFAFHLHQFDWLRVDTVAPERRGEILMDWIERHEAGVGWNPHPISLRILSWGKLLLTPGALVLEASARRRVFASLARQAETLMRHPERRLQANHLFSNWLGVVFAGALFRDPRADAWLACEAALRREMARQVAPDGSHIERSPMYHALLLENLLDLLNLGRGDPGRLPSVLVKTIEDTTRRMLGALAVWTHPDGEIALLGDAAFGIAQAPSKLAAYAAALGIVPKPPPVEGWLPGAGSARLEAGVFSLLASVAGPQPSYQPGHAHCDALSFELCVSGERVVTDTGVAEYREGALRQQSRSTRSHATLEVGGREQAELWSAHRVGGRPRVEVEVVSMPEKITATCAGWATPQNLHRRTFSMSTDGLKIADSLEGPGQAVRMVLPLAPGLSPRLVSAASGDWTCRIPLRSGAVLAIELPAGLAWTIEESVYLPEFGKRVPRPCLMGSADRFEGGSWRFSLETGAAGA